MSRPRLNPPRLQCHGAHFDARNDFVLALLGVVSLRGRLDAVACASSAGATTGDLSGATPAESGAANTRDAALVAAFLGLSQFTKTMDGIVREWAAAGATEPEMRSSGAAAQGELWR